MDFASPRSHDHHRGTAGSRIQYFTTDERWAAWWGPGSTIDARRGGRVFIRHPNGIEAGGEVVEVAAPDRIVFTYGFASGDPMPSALPGSASAWSRSPAGRGSTCTMTSPTPPCATTTSRAGATSSPSSRTSCSIALHAGASGVVERWFSAWSETDAATRDRALAGACRSRTCACGIASAP